MSRDDSAMSDERDQRRKPRPWLLPVAFAALLVIIAIVMPYFKRGGKKFHVSGDPHPIELVGIVPAGMDELYNIEGERIGPWRLSRADQIKWETIRRDYIFRLPKTKDPVVYLPPEIHPSGVDNSSFDYGLNFQMRNRYSSEAANWAGGKTVEVGGILPAYHDPGLLPNLMREFGGRKAEVPDRVDIKFRYYIGQRGPALCAFKGPFMVESSYSDPAHPAFTLSVTTKNNGSEIINLLNVSISANQNIDANTPLIVYDDQSRWEILAYGSYRRSKTRTDCDFYLKKMPLARIAKITLGEKPLEKTFHNVPVKMAGIQERKHMAYIDEVAARLNLTQSDPHTILNRQFRDTAEVMRVIDLIRGQQLSQAWNTFQVAKAQPEQFNAQDLGKIREAAKLAIASNDPWTQAHGCVFGLWGKWPEFVQPAFEIAQSADHVRGTAAHALSKYGDRLSTEQFKEVLRILNTSEDPVLWQNLIYVVMGEKQSPEIKAARMELAHSDKPWLWMRLLPQYLHEWNKDGQIDDTIAVRAVALGHKSYVADPAPYIPRAKALLVEIFTPKNVAKQSDGWIMTERIVKLHTREEATRIFIAYLERQLREWDDWKTPGMSDMHYSIVNRVVKHLNVLNGTELGGVGTDFNEDSVSERQRDWQAVAREAIAWSTTGVDPGKIPAGWKPGPHSVRVVWVNEVDPELSMIALWDPALPGENFTTMRFLHDFLNFRVTSFQNGTAEAECRVGVEKRQSGPAAFSFNVGRLPSDTGVVAEWRGKWHAVVESAATTSSALDGTQLFKIWRSRYLSDFTTGPMPRVFAMQSKEATTKYISERRSYRGWTPAEIALRKAIDLDPAYADWDIRSIVSLSNEHALAEWLEFLKRPDLTPEMKVFAHFRLASIYMRERGPGTESEMVLKELELARSIDPELVSEQTIQATNSWIHCREGTALEQAQRIVDGMNWLRTRTDAMIRKSARGAFIMTYGDDRSPVQTRTDPGGIKQQEEYLRRQLKEMIEIRMQNMKGIIDYLKQKDPAAAEYVTKNLKGS